jgi:hypothetical protein
VLELETLERADDDINEAEDVDVGEGDGEGDPSKPGCRHKKLPPSRVYRSSKCTLGASINHENALALEIFKEIGICVDGMTRTAFEAARFLNYFVSKLLFEEERCPRSTRPSSTASSRPWPERGRRVPSRSSPRP